MSLNRQNVQLSFNPTEDTTKKFTYDAANCRVILEDTGVTKRKSEKPFVFFGREVTTKVKESSQHSSRWEFQLNLDAVVKASLEKSLEEKNIPAALDVVRDLPGESFFNPNKMLKEFLGGYVQSSTARIEFHDRPEQFAQITRKI
jgi:hypothetical protein